MKHPARLDTQASCVDVLTQCNQELAGFFHEWANSAAHLSRLEDQYDRRYRTSLISLKDFDGTVGEKDARAHAAVDLATDDGMGMGLGEQLSEVRAECKGYMTRFRTLERISGNAQSVLSSHRTEARLGEFVSDGAPV